MRALDVPPKKDTSSSQVVLHMLEDYTMVSPKANSLLTVDVKLWSLERKLKSCLSLLSVRLSDGIRNKPDKFTGGSYEFFFVLDNLLYEFVRLQTLKKATLHSRK